MIHYSENDIALFANGSISYVQNLKMVSHILCCDICQQKLNKIDPQFLNETENISKFRNEISEGKIHYNNIDLKNYSEQTISIENRLKINKHLVNCEKCAGNLRKIDPEYMVKFVTDEITANRAYEASPTKLNVLNFKKISKFLVPAMALFLLTILSIGIVWTLTDKSIEQASVINGIPTEENEYNQGKINDSQNEVQTVDKKEITTTAKKGDKNVVSSNKKEPSAPTKNKRSLDKNGKKIILESRNLTVDCQNDTIVLLQPVETQVIDKNPILSWKKVENAISYKVYVSDSKNFLIEESIIQAPILNYKVKTNLENDKIYEWQVVASLLNGKEVQSRVVRFSVGDKIKKLDTKSLEKNSQSRCVNQTGN